MELVLIVSSTRFAALEVVLRAELVVISGRAAEDVVEVEDVAIAGSVMVELGS